ncbi:hypothetical protein SLA2020_067410 [Shorea laevis]
MKCRREQLYQRQVSRDNGGKTEPEDSDRIRSSFANIVISGLESVGRSFHEEIATKVSSKTKASDPNHVSIPH